MIVTKIVPQETWDFVRLNQSIGSATVTRPSGYQATGGSNNGQQGNYFGTRREDGYQAFFTQAEVDALPDA